MLHAVIMAGGAGTRFWPESRKQRPKQLLPLTGTKTLIEDTVERITPLVPVSRLLIVTSAQLVDPIRQLLPQLPTESVLGEPCKRDTAPCIGLAAELLLQRDPDAVMLVMPADHRIEPPEAFHTALQLAADIVERSPQTLVTFGIKPTYPAESFGYIERSEPVTVVDNNGPPVYQVARFREKPKAPQAKQFLDAGTFYWNAGIFVWKAATIRDALRQYAPEMQSHLARIAATSGTPDFHPTFTREFELIDGKSIDYTVMEHYPDVQVIEAPFEWDDVGSWQAMDRSQGNDVSGNTVSGRHIGVDTKGCIIRSTDKHLVATMGLEDVIIVHTPDATLVANKRDEESIRKLVALIEERGWREYL